MATALTDAQVAKICHNLSLPDLNGNGWWLAVTDVAAQYNVKPEAIMYRPSAEQYYSFWLKYEAFTAKPPAVPEHHHGQDSHTAGSSVPTGDSAPFV